MGRRGRLLARAAGHGPVHGHPQGPERSARRSGCSAPKRSSPPGSPTGRRSSACSRRRSPSVARSSSPSSRRGSSAASSPTARSASCSPTRHRGGRSSSPRRSSSAIWALADLGLGAGAWPRHRRARRPAGLVFDRMPSATVAAIAVAAVLTIGLQTGAAFFAGVGRGYIAPLAWTIAMIVLAQILTVLGWGSWFPWSVPAHPGRSRRGAGRAGHGRCRRCRGVLSCSRASGPRSHGGSAPTRRGEQRGPIGTLR